MPQPGDIVCTQDDSVAGGSARLCAWMIALDAVQDVLVRVVHLLTGGDEFQKQVGRVAHCPVVFDRERAHKVADLCAFEPTQSIFGSVENWWNGGGLGSVHSSVVAPSPQGLSGAFLPAASDQNRLTKKMATPAIVIM